MIITLRRAAAACALGALTAGSIATAALNSTPAAASSSPAAQHRVLAITTLTQFKVVLAATRSPGGQDLATVTASGYQQASTGWTLISSKTVGQPGQWFWYSVEACSFTVTQLKPLPSSAELASEARTYDVDGRRVAAIPGDEVGPELGSGRNLMIGSAAASAVSRMFARDGCRLTRSAGAGALSDMRDQPI
jgi:hypothetical protein